MQRKRYLFAGRNTTIYAGEIRYLEKNIWQDFLHNIFYDNWFENM